MLKAKSHRKRLFKAALALADMTAQAWCYKEGVRHSALSAVLNETLDHEGLERKIDAFIETHRDTYHALAS